MIDVIGVPFDLGGRRNGSRLGPAAVRQEGLIDGLQRIGVQAQDKGDVDAAQKRANEYGCDVYVNTKQKVKETFAANNVPLVLGGDHSISIGSVAAALDEYGDKLALLWVDAHMDMNTPETSPSGNLHGMSVAALAGLGENSAQPYWRDLLKEVVGAKKLSHERVAWIALRDVDAGEVANVRLMHGALPTTMQNVDGEGIRRVIEGVRDHFVQQGVTALWVSFDIDSIDPFYAPGTGTAVRGGLTYREGHFLAETLHQLTQTVGAPFKLAGVDVVEVNPLIDSHDDTAKTAVEWILSLFGKTILHALDPGRTER